MTNSTFYIFACHSCKSDVEEVRACSGCKLVYYCSIRHQRSNWKYHKDLCVCIQKIMKDWKVTNIFGVEEKTVNEWNYLRLSLISHVEKCLTRPLQLDEKQMFLFPKVCKLCFSSNVNKLCKCEDCKSYQYCCSEHMAKHIFEHRKECSDIKKCYVLDKICMFEEKNISKSLPSHKFPQINSKAIPKDIDAYLNIFIDIDNHDYLLLLSDQFSGSLTLLYSIFSIWENLSKETLNIHLIGSSSYELSFIYTLELLFHSIKNLKNIKISLVGPEIKNDNIELKLCNSCKGNIISIRIYSCLYQDLIDSGNFEQPDIVIAYNCGFNEFNGTELDSWAPTIRSILDLKNIMFLFTSYTIEEALADFHKVNNISESKGSKINVHFKHIENPFKSLRPQRNWEEGVKSIFYINHYLSILETI